MNLEMKKKLLSTMFNRQIREKCDKLHSDLINCIESSNDLFLCKFQIEEFTNCKSEFILNWKKKYKDFLSDIEILE